jgi:hypothetical protein
MRDAQYSVSTHFCCTCCHETWLQNTITESFVRLYALLHLIQQFRALERRLVEMCPRFMGPCRIHIQSNYALKFNSRLTVNTMHLNHKHSHLNTVYRNSNCVTVTLILDTQ